MKQNITRKKQVNQNKTLLKPKKEFETENNKKYKVETIIDSAVYGKETNN